MAAEKSRELPANSGKDVAAMFLPEHIAAITGGVGMMFRFRTEARQLGDRAIEQFVLLIYFGMAGGIYRHWANS
jgi:hypothetical protein